MLVVLVAHCATVAALLERRPHFDESQYLHAAWKMAQGERLYRDFAEDHAPFLFQLFALLMPEGGVSDYPLLDAPAYFQRARLLTALLGTLALLAGALIVRKAAGAPEAAAIFVAALAGTEAYWRLGIADARNDPFALFLMLSGALLILESCTRGRLTVLFSGLGMGLVTVAFLWNPKWPLESLVVGIAWLVKLYEAACLQRRNAIVGILAAIAPVAVALVIINSAASLRDYVFFTFEFNAALNAWLGPLHGTEAPLTHCPAAFHPVWVFPALALVVTAALLEKRRLPLVLATFVLAAGIEIRFLYVYPAAWPQYFLFWSLSSAAVYACVPRAILTLSGATRVRLGERAMRLLQTGLPVAAVVGAVTYSLAGLWAQTIVPTAVKREYWSSMSRMQKSLARGGTVWMEAPVHPTGAPDAHYYWFAFEDLLPFALAYAKTEKGSRFLPASSQSDLPICRVERGADNDLRFVSDLKRLEKLTPEAVGCFTRLVDSGRLVPGPAPRTYEVSRR